MQLDLIPKSCFQAPTPGFQGPGAQVQPGGAPNKG